MNLQKSVLIGTFVKKGKIFSFLEFLSGRFKINIDRVFIYEIEDNDEEYIVTFKAQKKEHFLKSIKHSTVLHVKNGSLFSINALNELIDYECAGTKVHSEYVLDWSKYKNKLIILTNSELNIKSINKIEDKSQLFK